MRGENTLEDYCDPVAEAGLGEVAESVWKLDGVGNWRRLRERADGEIAEVAHVPDARNAYVRRGWTDMAHDAQGNTTLDARGRTLRWDALGRLRAVVDDSGTTVATYTYDSGRRRVAKDVGGAVTQYALAGWQVLAEYDGGTTVSREFVYGRGIDEPVVMNVNLDGDGWTTGAQDAAYYYSQDMLGSVAAVTDVAGTITETYDYAPYGMPVVVDATGTTRTLAGSSMVGNPYLFTGRRWEAETGFYFYRNRYYDPETGRFLSQDPLGFIDGPNVYQYAMGAPQINVDPVGLSNHWHHDVPQQFWSVLELNGINTEMFNDPFWGTYFDEELHTGKGGLHAGDPEFEIPSYNDYWDDRLNDIKNRKITIDDVIKIREDARNKVFKDIYSKASTKPLVPYDVWMNADPDKKDELFKMAYDRYKSSPSSVVPKKNIISNCAKRGKKILAMLPIIGWCFDGELVVNTYQQSSNITESTYEGVLSITGLDFVRGGHRIGSEMTVDAVNNNSNTANTAAGYMDQLQEVHNETEVKQMIDYEEVINNAYSLIIKISLEVEYSKNGKIDSSQLRNWESKNNLKLQCEAVRFYTEYSNGIRLVWNLSKSYQINDNRSRYPKRPVASLILNKLEYVELLSKPSWRLFPDNHFYDVYKNNKYIVNMNKNYASWIILRDLGDGDAICMDNDTGQIVYYAHDWSVNSANGIGGVLGDSLSDFIGSWSKYYFIYPKYWPQYLEDGKINWESFSEDNYIY